VHARARLRGGKDDLRVCPADAGTGEGTPVTLVAGRAEMDRSVVECVFLSLATNSVRASSLGLPEHQCCLGHGPRGAARPFQIRSDLRTQGSRDYENEKFRHRSDERTHDVF
jgi:hypothetical protein